ncbi:MAG: hypothetical protein BWZ10_00963 [candidate division BRC1 bacterium ADurb.BinA364]|nr:MAG: hypothetical protein BWZ10_00963 [candidate division BRC1 bacterium ADurb.BinA364]
MKPITESPGIGLQQLDKRVIACRNPSTTSCSLPFAAEGACFGFWIFSSGASRFDTESGEMAPKPISAINSGQELTRRFGKNG